MIPVYGPPHAPEFHDDDQVAIAVSNRGGAPVTVTNYGVAMDGTRSKNNLYVMDRPAWGTTLPASVEPGGEPAQLLVPSGGVEAGSPGVRHPVPQNVPLGGLGRRSPRLLQEGRPPEVDHGS